jgi:hypothetical protein
MVHVAPMLSRVRNHFQGAKFARMSSGTYCVIRDLGLVKGGKGMRHHEVLVSFSLKAAWRWMAGVSKAAVVTRKRAGWLQRIPERMSENASQAVPAQSALRRLPRQ